MRILFTQRSLTLTLALCLFSLTNFANGELNPIAAKINEQQQVFKSLKKTALFQQSTLDAAKKEKVQKIVDEAAYLTVQSHELEALIKSPASYVLIDIPLLNGESITLELYQADIFSEGMAIYTASNPNQPLDYQSGIHYWGIVKDDPTSIAALSITKDEIMGMISKSAENFTLGKIENDPSGTHILYKDEDLKIEPNIACGTDDDFHYIESEEGVSNAADKSADNCLKVYVEIDYAIFQDKGGAAASIDYIAGAFSQVALLYANESINLLVSEMFVWDIEDPYTGPSTSQFLIQFRDHLDGNYNGDIAHLVGYEGNGGIAYVNALCNSKFSVGYSDVSPTYETVPTYSWTVEVLAHEIGHNIGSKHTHACVWNGNNTPIDGCGPAAGYSEGCDTDLPQKGTIMSYCHLVSGVGIDFGLGFGPQPGDLLRSMVHGSNCLSTCTMPTQKDASVTEIIHPAGNNCLAQISPEITILNNGEEKLTSVMIEYGLDGSTMVYEWNGLLHTGKTTDIILPVIDVTLGAHTFSARTLLPNGFIDSQPANDQQMVEFSRTTGNLYYLDGDNDGFGDSAISIESCEVIAGYVSNAEDCDDTASSIYPGAPCDDGLVCTVDDRLDNDCQCVGTPVGDSDEDGICDNLDQCEGFDDALNGLPCDDGNDCTIDDIWECAVCIGIPLNDNDQDGICDALDICPEGDDNQDFDGDGIPDACDTEECANQLKTAFENGPMSHLGPGETTQTLLFPSNNEGATFEIRNLGSRTTGKMHTRYVDVVTVSYTDHNGETFLYGTYEGNAVSQVNININGGVASLTVQLSNGLETWKRVRVNLTDVLSCADLDPIVQDVSGDINNHELSLYPNPAYQTVNLAFEQKTEKATVTFSNVLGQVIETYELNNEKIASFDLSHIQTFEQLVFVTIDVPGQKPITKRLYIAR